MVFRTLSLTCLFFINFFFDFFCKNLSYTYYFNYISSLNYLDTNVLYLLVFFSIYFSKIFRELFFFLLKFFFLSSSFSQIFFVKTLISSLVMGTILIHPVMFYIFLTVFLVKSYYTQGFVYVTYTRIVKLNLIFFLTTTMLLGGFWATQSNAWGYFWVNDLVEWVLLFIILLSILYLHHWFLNKIEYNFFYLEFFILNILVFIRLGFLSTRHSFIVTGFSLYIIIYMYIYLFYKIYSPTVYTKGYLRSQTMFVFFLFFLYQSAFLLLKFFFFSYFYIFFKKISKSVRLNYFHYILFIFFFILLSPFVFFKVLNIFSLNLNLTANSVFTESFISFFFFFDNGYLELLNIVTFLFTFFKYYYVTNFQVHLLLLLTNYQLVYTILSLISVFRKTGWT